MLGATIGVAGILVSGNSALALFTLVDSVPSNAFSTITLVAPTLNTATTQSGGAILLAWSASDSAAFHSVSYIALRAPHGSTTFVTVTGSPVSGLSYSDATPSDASYDYVVRTVAGNFSSGNSNTVTGLSDRTAPTISSWSSVTRMESSCR